MNELLDPRYMDDHIAGREHVKKILENGKRPNSFVVSLGGKFYLLLFLYSFFYYYNHYYTLSLDLGESKSVDETKELYAGTSRCLQLSHDYLSGFGTPFDVVGGKTLITHIHNISIYTIYSL